MMIPYTKTQAVGNDFLIVEWNALLAKGMTEEDLGELARRMCHRSQGIGADGLEVVFNSEQSQFDAALRIFNADGSEAEVSGNGTRAVAAFLVSERNANETLCVQTKAGPKKVSIVEHREKNYVVEMTMGHPKFSERDLGYDLEVKGEQRRVSILNVGNPQCVVFVSDFDFDWQSVGKEIETHSQFPSRTNVSFARILGSNLMDVRFWERGVGETASSGTGSTGAAIAGILSGQAKSPVRILTPGGELKVRWDGQNSAILVGSAKITTHGEFYLAMRASCSKKLGKDTETTSAF